MPMRRRDGIAAVVTALGTLVLPSCGNTQPVPEFQPLTTTNIGDNFTLALSGDILLAKAVPTTLRKRIVVNLLQQTDLAVANLEVSIVDVRPGKVMPASVGYLLTLSPPAVAPYRNQIGFYLLSHANKHTLDWGAADARETIRHFSAVGISAVGFGETSVCCTRPVFFTTPKGRVGLVAFTATFWPGWVAADPVGVIPGDPGVSALRTTRYDLVTRKQFATLRRIDSQHNPAEAIVPPPTGDNLPFHGVRFRAGEKPDTAYEMHPDDKADIKRNVRQAKQQSDLIVVSMHNHEQPGCDNPIASEDGSAWRCQKPFEFMSSIAREAIDNGADVFLDHGPHVLLRIEIYKERPIFYSLGSRFAQSESITQIRDGNPAGMTFKDTLPEWSEKFWTFYD